MANKTRFQFNFRHALEYPFRNWVACVLTPGLVYLAVMMAGFAFNCVITLVGVLVTFVYFGSDGVQQALQPDVWNPTIWSGVRELIQLKSVSDGLDLLSLPFMPSKALFSLFRILGQIVSSMTGMVFTVYFYGFQWHLLDVWRREGLDAPGPGVRLMKEFLKDGWKPFVFYMAINLLVLIPVMFMFGAAAILGANMPDTVAYFMMIFFVIMLMGCIVSLALSPYWLAPLAQSSQTRKFRDLWDISKAIQLVQGRYWRILTAMLLNLGMAMGYFLVTAIFGVVTCCLGFLASPFLLYGALPVSCLHLLAQAYNSPLQPLSIEDGSLGSV
ncbi:MAG: DUF4013 domain-containing protein [Vampirovibrionales bacterium]|nr:DUF4013 domain-containing protein [Vampirovibrionales bacterium]